MAKKKYNNEKCQRMKTGGGPPEKKIEEGNTSAIFVLISKQLETLENRFDSDESEILSGQTFPLSSILQLCHIFSLLRSAEVFSL